MSICHLTLPSSHASLCLGGMDSGLHAVSSEGRRKLVPQMPASQTVPIMSDPKYVEGAWLVICVFLGARLGSFGERLSNCGLVLVPQSPSEAPSVWKQTQRITGQGQLEYLSLSSTCKSGWSSSSLNKNTDHKWLFSMSGMKRIKSLKIVLGYLAKYFRLFGVFLLICYWSFKKVNSSSIQEWTVLPF